MPKNIPALKPKELIRILEHGDCKYYREGKGDHRRIIVSQELGLESTLRPKGRPKKDAASTKK